MKPEKNEETDLVQYVEQIDKIIKEFSILLVKDDEAKLLQSWKETHQKVFEFLKNKENFSPLMIIGSLGEIQECAVQVLEIIKAANISGERETQIKLNMEKLFEQLATNIKLNIKLKLSPEPSPRKDFKNLITEQQKPTSKVLGPKKERPSFFFGLFFRSQSEGSDIPTLKI